MATRKKPPPTKKNTPAKKIRPSTLVPAGARACVRAPSRHRHCAPRRHRARRRRPLAVCFRKDCTAHHIRFRSHGGGDQAWNLTPPCDDDHIDGIHTGRIRVTGRAPDQLVWWIGRQPVLVVRGREKDLLQPG